MSHVSAHTSGARPHAHRRARRGRIPNIAMKSSQKTLTKLFISEGVQERIYHGVGIAERREGFKEVSEPGKGQGRDAGENDEELKGPVGQPTDDVHGNDDSDHKRNASLASTRPALSRPSSVSTSVSGRPVRARPPSHRGQPGNEEGVEDADKSNGCEEAENERINDKQHITIRPVHGAREHARARTSLHHLSKACYWVYGYSSDEPGYGDNDDCNPRRTVAA